MTVTMQNVDAPFLEVLKSLLKLNKNIVMNQIDDKMAECLAIKVKIESAIINMKDGNESIVLRYRYINFSSWKKISERLNYTERQIFTFHGHALQSIEL